MVPILNFDEVSLEIVLPYYVELNVFIIFKIIALPSSENHARKNEKITFCVEIYYFFSYIHWT